jgi:RNA polymerase-interacting CarD/CdnL/TRCF family regulator
MNDKIQEEIKNQERIKAVKSVIEKKKTQLQIMKNNRSKFEEEKWSDAEIAEADALISQLANFISELNAVLV